MIDETLYAEPQLVTLYDVLNPWDIDREFYLTLPRRVPIRILDAGCGTGLLAATYAKAGHSVVGIDPAPAMLERAQARDGGTLVAREISTLQSFRTLEPFDLIVMTGHALPLAKIEALARQTGLTVDSVFGDWDRSALTESTPEVISS